MTNPMIPPANDPAQATPTETAMAAAREIHNLHYLDASEANKAAIIQRHFSASLASVEGERDALKKENIILKGALTLNDDSEIKDLGETVQKFLTEHETLRADLAAKGEALQELTKAACRVSDMGAQTGPQWVALTVAILGAKYTLYVHASGKGGRG